MVEAPTLTFSSESMDRTKEILNKVARNKMLENRYRKGFKARGLKSFYSDLGFVTEKEMMVYVKKNFELRKYLNNQEEQIIDQQVCKIRNLIDEEKSKKFNLMSLLTTSSKQSSYSSLS